MVSTPFDALSLTSTIAGIVALGIAVGAYFATRKQAVDAIKQAAVERRKTFELDVLRELLALLDGSSRVADLRSQGLIAVLPGDFPLWRRLADLAMARGMPADMAVVLDESGEPANDDIDKRITFALARETRAAIERRSPAITA